MLCWPGCPLLARRKGFYKGKELEEMDLQAILNRHPEVVIVDELAHTNIEGSKNSKRWQDVGYTGSRHQRNNGGKHPASGKPERGCGTDNRHYHYRAHPR
jgi:hypothetical protein